MASSASEPVSTGDRTSPAPLIGLTTYLEQAQTGVWDVRAAFLPETYFASVTRAGGIAVLLPPQPVDPGIAARVIEGLDGLIITGGKDVDPARYGQAPHPQTDAPRPERDAWEDALLSAAIESETPFLGICRGLQLINTARGGSLHQHLPDVVGSERYNAGGGVFSTNTTALENGSTLRDLLGDRQAIEVKSYHHQAVDELGEGLRVSARSEDGIVQAVEVVGVPFGLAVQWHPEQDDDLALFTGLVEAARAHRAARSASAAASASVPAPVPVRLEATA